MKLVSRLLVVLALLLGAPVLTASAASAHSVNDRLKIPVNVTTTVLLPPIATIRGATDLTVVTAPGFVITGASAGTGWSARVAPHAVVLRGYGSSYPTLVTLTGIAANAGRFPVQVYLGAQSGNVLSPEVSGVPADSTQGPAMSLVITALNGYLKPSSGAATPARPDSSTGASTLQVHRGAASSVRWMLIGLAICVLLVGRRTAPSAKSKKGLGSDRDMTELHA